MYTEHQRKKVDTHKSFSGKSTPFCTAVSSKINP